MDRVETLLHDTLADKAGQAPAGPVRLDAPARRKVLVAVTLVAASVLVVLVAVGVVAVAGAGHGTRMSRHDERATGPTTQVRHFPTPAKLPSGQRLAAYGSVSLLVPASLPTRASLCGNVKNEVVAPDDSATMCPLIAEGLSTHPGTVIWFSSNHQQAAAYKRIHTSPARLAGQRVRLGYATNAHHLGTGVSAVVKLPTQHIAVGITAHNRATVDRLLDSIRSAATNPLGCAARYAAAKALAAGPRNTMVSTGADAAIRCEYSDSGQAAGTLVGSYLLGQAATIRLADALNTLKPDPCHCTNGGTASPDHNEIIYFYDEHGRTLRITGTIGANLDSYTNGRRIVANFNGSIASMLARLTNQN